MAKSKGMTVLLCTAVIGAVLGYSTLAMGSEAPEGGAAVESAAAFESPWVWFGAFGAAAASIAVSVIGASWAVSKIGAAAMGAIAEKPELAMRAMLFVALAEGLAIYGLIVAIMVLSKLPS